MKSGAEGNVSGEGTRFSAKPIGEGYFGSIYNQFKGDAQGAAEFFNDKKEGDLLGVFSRDGFGEIDAVWGDEGGGVAHIIQKHVGEGKSFKSLSEAFEVISNLIANGRDVYNKSDKAVFKIGSRLVTVRKNIRENGKKIADKNWILTAYDENAGDNTSAISGINQGQAAPTPAISVDKDNTSDSEKQGNKTLFRVVKDKNELVAVHNISEDNLRK